jgi:hypothetical protein
MKMMRRTRRMSIRGVTFSSAFWCPVVMQGFDTGDSGKFREPGVYWQ